MNFKHRSYELEIMDDLEMEGEELASTLRQIAVINRWLGGSSVTLAGVKKLLKGIYVSDKTLKIIDMGCGGGESLRLIADWGRKTGQKLELIGIDANLYTIDYAREQCKAYSEIRFEQLNVFSEGFANLSFDIALCNLFLHHFTEVEIGVLLKTMTKSATIGIVINDLQRNYLAYYLFHWLTLALGASKMVRYDGKLSIRRAFKKKEIEQLLANSHVTHYDIQWKWAFRYQVIIHSFKP